MALRLPSRSAQSSCSPCDSPGRFPLPRAGRPSSGELPRLRYSSEKSRASSLASAERSDAVAAPTKALHPSDHSTWQTARRVSEYARIAFTSPWRTQPCWSSRFVKAGGVRAVAVKGIAPPKAASQHSIPRTNSEVERHTSYQSKGEWLVLMKTGGSGGGEALPCIPYRTTAWFSARNVRTPP